MSLYLTQSVGPYSISDDPTRLDLKAMHGYLQCAYWSEQIPLEVLERAVRGSLCIGAYDATGAQIGLARFISDYATFCYVCDVYVLEEHRCHGISKAMMPRTILRRKSSGISPDHGCARDDSYLWISDARRSSMRRSSSKTAGQPTT